MEGIYKWVYLTQSLFVVMGDGVMVAVEYVRNVSGNSKPTE
jgi:hypothetical protein